MGTRRCEQVKVTNEARVLKELRVQNNLSMFGAGKLIDRSDSYISHLENGRMDLPQNGILFKLLEVYKCSMADFEKRVKGYKSKFLDQAKLNRLIGKLDNSDLKNLSLHLEKLIKDKESS